METTLHRELKSRYAVDADCREVWIDGYRIDAVCDNRLIEIQCGSLGAIRRKVAALLAKYDVHIVKPLAARKFLVTHDRPHGLVVSSRYSPLRESHFHLFDDLVHFLGIFPHPRLTLEAVLTEQEEHRVAVRRRWRKSYRVHDRQLREIISRVPIRTPGDLLLLLPPDLPAAFTTADLAEHAEIPRWLAQKMAYCLRKTGAVETTGKQRNSLVYRVVRPAMAVA